MTRGTLVVAAGILALTGCSGGSSGGGSASSAAGVSSSTPSATTSGSSAAPTSSATAVAQLGHLEQAVATRRDAYLRHSASSTSGGYYVQLARLETGQSVARAPLDDMLDFMDSRRDTADFKCSGLLRLLYLHGNNASLPQDWRDRAKQTLLQWKYWIDEPGQDSMVYWSENHYILFAACEYLAGQLYPREVFSNSGLSGEDHWRKARSRILRWLDQRMRFGFGEWYSPVYYPHDIAPLLNLVDFANDPEIRTRAAMVLDLLVFDLARLTIKGSFGTTAGRIYEEHKWTGRRQSCGDLIEVLFGTRGGFRGRGATAASNFCTSTYRVPHVLLAIGQDKQRRYVGKARVGLTFAEGPSEGIGFSSLEDGMFWWTQGAYLAPETIALTRDMCVTYDLFDSAPFSALKIARSWPASLLQTLSGQLGAASEGSVLGGANTYCFRSPHAQLSSVIDYRRGKVGFQQHAWQATLDLDCSVWTTAPGNFGRYGPGEWTGSGSLPQVFQHEDVALILYNPRGLQRSTFRNETHAWFPKADFDAVTREQGWVFGQKGQGYVALWSAQPQSWRVGGSYDGKELYAPGFRNAWVCQVGGADEDGSFDQFRAKVLASSIRAQGGGDEDQGRPLWVEFDAPDLGPLRLEWGQAGTLRGAAAYALPFPRFEDPYVSSAWGDPRLEIRLGLASLALDRNAGTRSGDGL